MNSLFANRPPPGQSLREQQELERMRIDLVGLHRRVGESMDLLARLVASDPTRFPQGLAAVIEEQLDRQPGGGQWAFMWNGTAREITATPAGNNFSHRLWAQHCTTYRNGMPAGLWHDTGGWQDAEDDWLSTLEAHVVRREQSKGRV